MQTRALELAGPAPALSSRTSWPRNSVTRGCGAKKPPQRAEEGVGADTELGKDCQAGSASCCWNVAPRGCGVGLRQQNKETQGFRLWGLQALAGTRGARSPRPPSSALMGAEESLGPRGAHHGVCVLCTHRSTGAREAPVAEMVQTGRTQMSLHRAEPAH